jgi:signal peptidase I
MGSSGANPLRRRTPLRRIVASAVLVVLVVGAIVLFTPGLVFEHFWVPTPSMAATLIPGDHVLVDRLAYSVNGPRRGDVIVFHPPGKQDVYIKRVVGLPGDRISLRNGHVFINGKRLREPYLREDDGVAEPTDPWACAGAPTAWSLVAAYTVPAGEYFVMGDNRTDSDDSRDWGPVPRSRILGEAIVTIWPLGHIRLL